MTDQIDFEKARKWVEEYHEMLDDAAKKKLYGLYKQSTAGNAPSDANFGLLDFKGKAKHAAWRSNVGMGSSEAQLAYVAVVKECIQKLSSQ